MVPSHSNVIQTQNGMWGHSGGGWPFPRAVLGLWAAQAALGTKQMQGTPCPSPQQRPAGVLPIPVPSLVMGCHLLPGEMAVLPPSLTPGVLPNHRGRMGGETCLSLHRVRSALEGIANTFMTAERGSGRSRLPTGTHISVAVSF